MLSLYYSDPLQVLFQVDEKFMDNYKVVDENFINEEKAEQSNDSTFKAVIDR